MSAMLYALLIIASAMPVIFWIYSTNFISWFWQESREEAEMLLADERSSKQYPKLVSKPVVACMLVAGIISTVLLFTHNLATKVLIIKFIACFYLIFLALIDYRTLMLPDILNYIGLWSGLLLASYGLSPYGLTVDECVVGAFVCYMICWLIIQFGYKVLKKAIMGHGDAKLLSMFGAWFGLKHAYLVFFTGILLTSAFANLQFLFLKKGSYNKTLPFGPFMAIAGISMIIYHDQIILYLKNSYPSIF